VSVKLSSVDEYLDKTAGTITEAFKGLLKALWAGGTLPRTALLVAPPLVAGAAAFHALGGGGISEGKRQAETLSYRINRNLNSLTDRIRADELVGESFASTLGGDTAKRLVGLTTDMFSKGYDTLKDKLVTSPARHAVFEALKREDPILGETDNKTLLEAYHTMSKVAPTLSTDKNAVRSFLTQAAVSGGGLDYNTIKGIADAETAVGRARNPQ